MGSAIINQLERFGPRHCQRLGPAEARAYVGALARGHYENFTVVSRLVPARLREHFAAVYAFCRWADDLGDEVGDTHKSMALLGWWRDELRLCYTGKPRHPVFVALEETVKRFEIPAQPFEDLISAFEQDQNVRRYQCPEQVTDYCTRSANPVGRLVLYLCGYADAERQRLSDATCTALQLANFWQDIRRDILERDRIYVPADVLENHGLDHQLMIDHVRGTKLMNAGQSSAMREVVGELVAETRPMFEEGRKLWAMVRREVRLPIRLFTMGGERVLWMIQRGGFDTLDRRPAVGKMAKMWLMGRGMVAQWMDRREEGTDAGRDAGTKWKAENI